VKEKGEGQERERGLEEGGRRKNKGGKGGRREGE